MSVEFHVEFPDDIARMMAQAAEHAPEGLRRAIIKTGEHGRKMIQDEMANTIKVHGSMYNDMRNKLRAVPRMVGKAVAELRIGINALKAAEIASYLETGTPAHEIRPRFKKALAWASQSRVSELFGGKATLRMNTFGQMTSGAMKRYGNAALVVVKKVWHPGTIGYHIFEAVQRMLPDEPKVQRIFEEEVAAALRKALP